MMLGIRRENLIEKRHTSVQNYSYTYTSLARTHSACTFYSVLNASGIFRPFLPALTALDILLKVGTKQTTASV